MPSTIYYKPKVGGFWRQTVVCSAAHARRFKENAKKYGEYLFIARKPKGPWNAQQAEKWAREKSRGVV